MIIFNGSALAEAATCHHPRFKKKKATKSIQIQIGSKKWEGKITRILGAFEEGSFLKRERVWLERRVRGLKEKWEGRSRLGLGLGNLVEWGEREGDKEREGEKEVLLIISIVSLSLSLPSRSLCLWTNLDQLRKIYPVLLLTPASLPLPKLYGMQNKNFEIISKK